MNQKQKDTFFATEGDAWFERNHLAISRHHYNENDPIIKAVDHCLVKANTDGGITLLEVGCGEGKRLQWLQENRILQCSGVEPSSKAVELATSRGVHAVKGTADSLPFADHQFDFVVFGFCLYLCDREDLFKIAYEADRVLKKTGWLIIHDFFSMMPMDKSYHHLEGIRSYKMDYRKLWDWNPFYTCYSQQISCHGTSSHCDDPDEWVATSVLRKKQN